MKKSIIILIFIICTTTVSAQMNMSFGLKGGLSLNHMWGDDWDGQLVSFDAENAFRLGFSVGGFATININENIAIQPEVYLSLIGGGMDYTESGNEMEDTRRLWVVEIPILIKLTMPAGNFRGSVYAGGDIMIKVFDYTVEINGEEDDTEDDSLFNRPYFGLVGGIEMNIPISDSLYFIADVRYVCMLSDIFNKRTTSNPEYKSNSIKFLVGIGTGR